MIKGFIIKHNAKEKIDIVGKIGFKPNEKFEINYNYSADSKLDTVNYNFLEANFQ